MKKYLFSSLLFLTCLIATPQDNSGPPPLTNDLEQHIQTPPVTNETGNNSPEQTNNSVTTNVAVTENEKTEISEGTIMDSGFDPKNRGVVLIKTKTGFKVEKEMTCFLKETSSEEEARKHFSDQLESSNNL
ncbi:MAG: hypothetical protein ACXVNR_07580 [Bacteroidia bacterium]